MSKAYDANSMKVLKGLEAVRTRPTMYIGSLGEAGRDHCAKEIVDNSVDEALAGHCTVIDVIIDTTANYVTIRDNGRGIPTGINQEEGISGIEIAATHLHGGGKFDSDSYKTSGGLNGVGLSAVNALAEHMEVSVTQNDEKHTYTFSRGVKTGFTKFAAKGKPSGTVIKYKLDSQIFDDGLLPNIANLREMCLQRSFLCAGLQLNFQVDNQPVETFQHNNGIADYADYLLKEKFSGANYVMNPTLFSATADGVEAEICMAFHNSTKQIEPCEYSFVNSLFTFEGGTHITGYKRGLSRSFKKVFDDRAKKFLSKKDQDVSFTGDDIRENIIVIINVRHSAPEYVGNKKGEIGNRDLVGLLDGMTSQLMIDALTGMSDAQYKAMVNKVLIAAKSRDSAKRSREMSRSNDGSIFSLSNASKLTPCETNDPTIAELIILEGDSAGGNAENGRNPHYQAIFPLKGKILNTYSRTVVNSVGNKEISDLVNVLGTSFGKNFNIEKLKYHKIILAPDADVDGLHISSLGITLFLMHFPQLIEAGYVYLACPPLYTIKEGREVSYCRDDAALQEFLAKRIIAKVGITNKRGLSTQIAKIIPAMESYIREFDRFVKSHHISKEVASALISAANEVIFNEGEDATLKGIVDCVYPTFDDTKVICKLVVDEGRYVYFINKSSFFNDLKKVSAIEQKLLEENGDMLSYMATGIPEDKSVYEVIKHMVSAASRGIIITYLKGLGELEYDALWETTLNPEQRHLIQLRIEDIDASNNACGVLMGPASKYANDRRSIIIDNLTSFDIESLDSQGS